MGGALSHRPLSLSLFVGLRVVFTSPLIRVVPWSLVVLRVARSTFVQVGSSSKASAPSARGSSCGSVHLRPGGGNLHELLMGNCTRLRQLVLYHGLAAFTSPCDSQRGWLRTSVCYCGPDWDPMGTLIVAPVLFLYIFPSASWHDSI